MARGDDDLVFLLIAAAVGFFFVSRSSSVSGGAAIAPVFEPEAPVGSMLGDVLGALLPMRVSANGRAFIKAEEGFNLYPYADAGGQAIYWGHEIRAGETFTNTTDDAERYFDSDVGDVESELNAAVHVPLSQNQFDALADLVFNLTGGVRAMPSLIAAVNRRDYAGAAALFAEYNHSQGRVNDTLTRRRAAEANLFGTGSPTGGTPIAGTSSPAGTMLASGTGTTGSPYV